MSLTVHESLEQGSEEWLQARCGIVTASVLIIRPHARKRSGWWRICYHGHPTPDHYTSAATANNAAARHANKRSSLA